MKLYVDVMGGDHGPSVIIKGCIEAIKEYDVSLILVGNKDIIEEVLLEENFDNPRISILNATETISFNEEPVKAIRRKKDSSIVVALRHMKEDDPENSVLISAGSTGALLAGGTLILGRIKGVKRPGLGTYIPQEDKSIFMIDVGASSDAQPDYLLTYAKLATVYLEAVDGRNNPTVGLLNVGAEEEKGNLLLKESYQLIKNSNLNFFGNIESRDIFTTEADIVVCDGFTGNIEIKTIEGIASFLFDGLKKTLLSSIKGKIGALLIKNDLKAFKAKYDSEEIGGSPLLGVRGGVIKAHGSSSAYAIKNAIRQAISFAQKEVVKKMTEELEK